MKFLFLGNVVGSELLVVNRGVRIRMVVMLVFKNWEIIKFFDFD